MFRQELQAEWQRVKWIVATVAAYVVLGVLYLQARDAFTWRLYVIYVEHLWVYFVISLPLFTVAWLMMMAIIREPQAPDRHLRAQLTPQALARYATGYGLTLLTIPFIGTFTQIKISLSADGFGWDPALADIEAWLHGGIQPAEWLGQVLGGGTLLRIVELNYDLVWQWYNLVFFSFMMLYPAARHVRRFYFFFHFGMWVVLGNVLAGMFICAGPAFYELVTGDGERFAALQALLYEGRDHAHSAYNFQRYLWLSWTRELANPGTGIAAFPSLHVFAVVCNALFFYRYFHRGIGLLAMIYAAFVLFSSAYLGWHYLIDGYVSILLAVPIFYAVARRDPA